MSNPFEGSRIPISVVVNLDQNPRQRVQPNRWIRYANRPALIILLFFLGLSIGLYYYLGLDFILVLFLFYLLSPMIPAVNLESKWQKATNNGDSSSSIMYDVIKKHRFTFIMAGVVLSFIQLLVGIFLKFLVFETTIVEGEIYRVEYDINIISLIVFIITTIFIATYVTASFYRVRSEDYTSGERYNYISSPSQVTLLLSYTFIGVNLDFAILWFAHAMNKINPESFRLIPLEYLTSGLIIPLLIMNLIFFPTAIFVAGIIPSLIMGSIYRKPSRNQTREWLIKLILFVIGVAVITVAIARLSTNLENGKIINLIHSILLAFPIFLIIYIANKYPVSGKMCPMCNLLMDKNEFCKACSEGEAIPIRINFISKLQHPYCPSCGTIWSTLSRKCVNTKCNYTILLSCEKCSQTLNPLWDRCNVCGEKRKPIPLLALQSPGSPSYARNQAFLMILASFLIPAVILQITIIINIFSRVNNRIYPQSALDTVYDDIGRAILLLITIIAIFTIILASFDERKRPMMLVANRIATSAGSILISTAFLVLFFFTLMNIFTQGIDGLFSRIITLIFALLMALSSTYNYYKSLIQFRPIVGFDPTIALDKIGGN